MLNDIKYIAQRDKSDALGVAEKQPLQLLYDFNFTIEIDPADVSNVVVAGMGGSAIAGNMVMNWPRPRVPVVVSRGYELPPFVGVKTLVVVSSYSGNTEEALSQLEAAKQSGCRIAVIAAGGELEKQAVENDFPFAKVPAGLQPRMAVWYMFRALVELLQSAQVTEDGVDELEAAAEMLQTAAENWRPDVPVSDNYAKQLAEEIAGKTPIIYAASFLSTAAYKWKIDFNENAKNVAFHSILPEVNHNEMIGWTSQPVNKPFAPIQLQSNLYDERIQKRFENMNRLLSGRMPASFEVRVEGQTPLEQMLWSILLGDFVSIYLALVNNVDPTPVELLEKFKIKLSES